MRIPHAPGQLGLHLRSTPGLPISPPQSCTTEKWDDGNLVLVRELE